MTSIELEIVQYMKQAPDAFFARKEIARRARAREEYEAEPNWASAPLSSLVSQGVLEQNDSGHYKLSAKFQS